MIAQPESPTISQNPVSLEKVPTKEVPSALGWALLAVWSLNLGAFLYYLVTLY